MYKYLILFILIIPLIGIYSVEHGSYAGSVGVDGYPNGAFEHYLYYVLLILITAFVITKTFKTKSAYDKFIDNKQELLKYKQFSWKLLIFNALFLLIMLFVFGGIKVWLGQVDKGFFRANLGGFGAFAYLMTKTTIPALFAYATIGYKTVEKTFYTKALWCANVAVILIVGSTWGFKSTGAVMMLPGILILFWDVRFITVLKLAVFFSLLFLTLTVWFDTSEIEKTGGVLIFLIDRLTVLQGDVSWYLWGKYQDGAVFQNYFPTLLAAIGDGNLRMLGYDPKNLYSWMEIHYDWMLTYNAGLPLETIAEGHSIVGSPFSEGLIAGGVIGIYVFSLIAGTIIGVIYCKLKQYVKKANKIKASLLSAFFCLNVFPWLSGGAITQLFHISVFVAYIFTFVVILVFNTPFTKSASSVQLTSA